MAEAVGAPQVERLATELVRQEMMYEFEADLIEQRQSAKVANLQQENTWHSSINGLAQQLRAVMFWLTFESPTVEKLL